MTSQKLFATVVSENSATAHVIRELPVLVIMPHSRCNCRCVMCDIWRIRQIREITAADLEPHIASLRELKVRWVVFSGGEALLHSDLWTLARLLRREGIRTTLLTAGLILERHAAQVTEHMDDVIVSLDGPREIHDRIRGVPNAYQRLQQGIEACKQCCPTIGISARCTVQRSSFRHLRATVQAALELKLDSLSFLAADMSSDAFNHAAWPDAGRHNVALTASEVDALSNEISRLFVDYPQCFRSGFIRETPEKLRRVGLHFRAQLGELAPEAPRCNAPWVSAVIESDGAVRPCFFHEPLGNIHSAPLGDVLNGDAALRFRTHLDISSNPTCQRCVCSLFLEVGSLSRVASTREEARRIARPVPA